MAKRIKPFRKEQKIITVWTGASDSGKTTILNQMRAAYSKSIVEDRLKADESQRTLYRNIIQALRSAIQDMSDLGFSYEHEASLVSLRPMILILFVLNW